MLESWAEVGRKQVAPLPQGHLFTAAQEPGPQGPGQASGDSQTEQTQALPQELPLASWGLLESRKQALPQLVAALSWLNKRVNGYQAHSRQALVTSGGPTAQPHSYPQHTDIEIQGLLSLHPQCRCPLLTADESSRPEPLTHPYRTPFVPGPGYVSVVHCVVQQSPDPCHQGA